MYSTKEQVPYFGGRAAARGFCPARHPNFGSSIPGRAAAKPRAAARDRVTTKLRHNVYIYFMCFTRRRHRRRPYHHILLHHTRPCHIHHHRRRHHSCNNQNHVLVNLWLTLCDVFLKKNSVTKHMVVFPKSDVIFTNNYLFISSIFFREIFCLNFFWPFYHEMPF